MSTTKQPFWEIRRFSRDIWKVIFTFEGALAANYG